jgi:anaphase-promoting complex subunit 2
MRKLIWHHELGSVTLNLTFDNGDFEFKCLPLHATIL